MLTISAGLGEVKEKVQRNNLQEQVEFLQECYMVLSLLRLVQEKCALLKRKEEEEGEEEGLSTK